MEKPPVATRTLAKVSKEDLALLTQDLKLTLSQNSGKSWLLTPEGKTLSSVSETPLFPEFYLFSIDPRDFPEMAIKMEELPYVTKAFVGQE